MVGEKKKRKNQTRSDQVPPKTDVEEGLYVKEIQL